MKITESQRKELIAELESILKEATEVKTSLYYVVEHYHLYNEPEITPASNLSYKFVGELKTAIDALVKAGVGYIQSYVTGWYTDLHFDMSDPIKEVPEDKVQPPIFESVIYQGDNKWEVIMQTETHGRERVIVHSNAASWADVYSADKIGEGHV